MDRVPLSTNEQRLIDEILPPDVEDLFKRDDATPDEIEAGIPAFKEGANDYMVLARSMYRAVPPKTPRPPKDHDVWMVSWAHLKRISTDSNRLNEARLH